MGLAVRQLQRNLQRSLPGQRLARMIPALVEVHGLLVEALDGGIVAKDEHAQATKPKHV